MNNKIQSAKVDAILDPNLCFFGALMCNLRFQEDNSPSNPTAWTDGTTLGYNSAFVDKLAHAEIVGLLAHEVMHCAAGHPYRRDNREPKRWNVACDYAINQILSEAGIILPKGSLVCPPEFVGKSSEWIYDRLPEMPPDPNGGTGAQGQGNGPGEVRDSPQGKPDDKNGDSDGDSPADDTDTINEGQWKELARQAAVQAKQRGKLPAGLDRFSKEVAQSRIDWKAALRKFVQQHAKLDYTWSQPSSRYVSQGIYLPSLHSEDMPAIAIAVDTSGSIDDVALAKAKAEIVAVMDECQPSRVDVFYADARVAKHDSFERGEPIEFRPAGGGGTDFRPVFKAVDKMEDAPVCIIYITDLCGSFPDHSEIPTLWVTDTEGVAPFGETIRM